MMNMNKTGIYKIQSKRYKNRIYIGSAINVNKRWNQHRNDLKNNKHHSLKLQRHFNKYGVDDLTFILIEECLKENLLIREQFYLDTTNTYFNICKIAGNCLGRTAWNKNKKMSVEFSNKMKIASIGNQNHLGHKHTIETINRLKKYIPVNKGKTKLKKEEIIEIQNKYIPRKYSLSMLAREYNVSKQTVLDIIHLIF
jgi:group I intron endonuclease